MRALVAVIGVGSIVALGLVVYVYLWVFDVVGNGGGTTHWQHPLRVAVLTALALVLAGVALRSLGAGSGTSGPRTARIRFLLAGAGFITVCLLVTFDAVATIA